MDFRGFWNSCYVVRLGDRRLTYRQVKPVECPETPCCAMLVLNNSKRTIVRHFLSPKNKEDLTICIQLCYTSRPSSCRSLTSSRAIHRTSARIRQFRLYLFCLGGNSLENYVPPCCPLYLPHFSLRHPREYNSDPRGMPARTQPPRAAGRSLGGTRTGLRLRCSRCVA
jgi:hypothetical protein